jgi:copper(I)-binding protein
MAAGSRFAQWAALIGSTGLGYPAGMETTRSILLAVLATLAFLLPVNDLRAADAPVVSDAWARATAPGAAMGAAYLAIAGGAEADALKAVSTKRAQSVEMHTVEQADGVMKMRELDSVEVPAGKRVQFAPGGMHLMLIGLGSPLVAGERFEMQLEFAIAGTRSVIVEVRPATAGGDHAQHTR